MQGGFAARQSRGQVRFAHGNRGIDIGKQLPVAERANRAEMGQFKPDASGLEARTLGLAAEQAEPADAPLTIHITKGKQAAALLQLLIDALQGPRPGGIDVFYPFQVKRDVNDTFIDQGVDPLLEFGASTEE